MKVGKYVLFSGLAPNDEKHEYFGIITNIRKNSYLKYSITRLNTPSKNHISYYRKEGEIRILSNEEVTFYLLRNQ